MVPVGAIVAAVVVALRAVAAAQNRQKDDGASRPAASVPISRGSSTFWQDSGAAGTLVYQAILLGCFLGLTSVAFEVRHPVPLVFGLLAGWLLFPAWVARSVLAPLGLVRLAYASAWLSRVTWRRDKPGGPALVAAWGLAQQEKPSPSAIAWVEQRLTGTRRALQGSGVVAYGLLEAAKGKLDSARDWLEAVLNFDPRVAPVHVRAFAAEWLACDAAARGDWQRVQAIVDNRKWPGTPVLRLLGALAGRMRGERLPTNFGLWFWWLLCPRRLWTFGFVRQATAYRPPLRTATAGPALAAPAELEPLARATFTSLSLRHGPPSEAVVEAARAWEDALGPSLRTQLFERATLIGGGEPDAALEEVRGLVERAFGPLLPPKLGPEVPALLGAAAQAQRDALYRELEERMDRMDERKKAQRALPVLEEWREVMALRGLYQHAVNGGGPAERSLAFSIVRDKAVNYGVWLYNERAEKPVANAVFRWLEAEAVALGDAESERLNKKNAACDL